MSQAIEELQIKVAYLENLHEELNQVVVQLQSENLQLKQQLADIQTHLKNQGSASGQETSLFAQLAEEKPPHY